MRGLEHDDLRRLRCAASSPRPADESRQPRQNQRRISMTEVRMLIKEYEQRASVKDLAQRFGIHRLTVTALLRRHGVELRRAGLTPEQIRTAEGCTAKAGRWRVWGARFGVHPTTVWRALRGAGVTMRPPGQRR
jgi:transposase